MPISEVTSYRAADGSLHPTYAKAAQHEAEAIIRKGLDNPALIAAIVNNSALIYEALSLMYAPQFPMPTLPDKASS